MQMFKRILFACFAIIFAFVMIGVLYSFQITSRDIERPTGKYTEAFQTHGGTVYVTKGEKLFEDASKLAIGGMFILVMLYTVVRRGAAQKRSD